MADQSVEERIRHMRELVEEMHRQGDNAREEALVATEQLLTRARKHHEETMRQHRETHGRINEVRAERQSKRRP